MITHEPWTALMIVWLMGEALAPLALAFLLPRPYRVVALIIVGAAVYAWETYSSYTGSLVENGGDWSRGWENLELSATLVLAQLLPLWLLGAGIGTWLRRRMNGGGHRRRRSVSPTA